MAIRTFRGKSAAAALAQVKQELGADAVILHTRTERTGGVMGIGRSTIFEITATAAEAYRKPKPRAASPAPRPAQKQAPAPSARTPVDRSVANAASFDDSTHLQDTIRDFARLAEATEPTVAARVRSPQRAAVAEPPNVPGGNGAAFGANSAGLLDRLGTDEPAPRVAPPSRRVPLDDPPSGQLPVDRGDDRHASLAREMAELRRMVGCVLTTQRRSLDAAGGLSEPLMQAYMRLVDAEVSPDLAEALIGRVRDALTRAELDDARAVERCVQKELAALIPAHGHVAAASRGPDDRPLTIALIGPTGVGKTTTLAKLAASYRLRRGLRVAMITCDTYRIAAVDQLRTYAGIIGCELKVVSSPEQMPAACEALRDHDVLLIDTAGRSPRDSARIDELRRHLRAARPHRTHLVLSATSGERAIKAATSVFGKLRPDHAIFTKVDEADALGLIVNTMHTLDATLSYVTTGQEVPDDLEPAEADRLAWMILDAEARS